MNEEEKIRQLHEEYGVKPQTPAEPQPPTPLEKLREEWSKDSQAPGCLAYLLQIWEVWRWRS